MDGRAEKLPVSRGYWCWWQAPDDVVRGSDNFDAFRNAVREILEMGFYIVTLEALRGVDAYGRAIVVAVASLGGVDDVRGEYLQSVLGEHWHDVAAQLEVKRCAICGATIVAEIEADWSGWIDMEGDQLSYVPNLHDHTP